MDDTRIRQREREALAASEYEIALQARADFIARAQKPPVIHDSDREWKLYRQGYVKIFLLPAAFPDTMLQQWWVFIHDVKSSGKHRHQGGLVLFVLEGAGASEVDGEIVEWEEGDMVLLPLKKNGVEHRHYTRGDNPAKWIAFIHEPTWDLVSSELTQIDASPDFSLTNAGN